MAYTSSVDRLRVQIDPDRATSGAAAGSAVANALRHALDARARARIVFAAAPSQDALLAALSGADGVDWARVTAFHMDEYLGLPPGAPQLFSTYLHEHILDAVRPGEIALIDGSAEPEREAARYAAALTAEPIDVVCLGIGENGHLAFNDPGVADFDDPLVMKVVELDETSRQQQVHDGCYAQLADVPRRALTLTVPALLSAGTAVVVVPGPTKARAVHAALTGPIDARCPASALRRHPNAALFLDRDAAGLLPEARDL